MRHNNRNRKFGRTRDQRTALVRGLASALIRHGRVQTTLAKAKTLRSFVEKLVTLGKKDDLASKRLVSSRLGNGSFAIRLVKEISPRYKSRAGGYTRIIKMPQRKSDSARLAIIEFV